ncbi:unnamed protein product [Urochloa humidicola]
MSNMTSTCKNIMLYVDHSNFLERQIYLSGRQHCDVFHDKTQLLPPVQHTSSKTKSNCIEIEDGDMQDLSAYEDSELDSDFIDSDYELDIDDDDLFGQNVDDVLTDEDANTKGKEVVSEDELEKDSDEDVVGRVQI